MEKMIFSKEEIKNLIMMLQSEDEDNHTIAFESLKSIDFKNCIGELIVMYKFIKHPLDVWETNCKPVIDKLKKVLDKDITNLSSPKTLSLITANNGSKASVELFMEFFVRDMTKMLESIGYPTDKFEIDIKLKD